MPDKPVTTTLADLARGVGATAKEIDQLSPRVRKLTKGHLLALWGATSTPAATDAFSNSQQGSRLPSPMTIEPTANVPLDLTLQDVSSIQKVFTPERVQAALGSTGTSGGDVQPAGITACCCSPCCCSGSMLEDPDVLT